MPAAALAEPTLHAVYAHVPRRENGRTAYGRTGQWKRTATGGAAKAQNPLDATIVRPVEGGFTYTHLIEGVGPVDAPEDHVFSSVGLACLAADLDFPDSYQRVLDANPH